MKLTFTLISEKIRQTVMARVRAAPVNWRVTIEEPKRSDVQNDRFWAALGQFAKEAEHFGKKLTPDTWKVIFLHQLGAETEFVPSLDGSELIPIGHSSRNLPAPLFSDLIELVYATGSERGIVFREPRLDPDWTPRRAKKGKSVGVTREQLQIEGEAA